MKRFYARTNKNHAAFQIAQHMRRAEKLRIIKMRVDAMRARLAATEVSTSAGPVSSTSTRATSTSPPFTSTALPSAYAAFPSTEAAPAATTTSSACPTASSTAASGVPSTSKSSKLSAVHDAPVPPALDKALPYTSDPGARYHVADSQRDHDDVTDWVASHHEDPALKVRYFSP